MSADFVALQAKVDALKAMVEEYSITPQYMGAILDAFIEAMKQSGFGSSSPDTVARKMAAEAKQATDSLSEAYHVLDYADINEIRNTGYYYYRPSSSSRNHNALIVRAHYDSSADPDQPAPVSVTQFLFAKEGLRYRMGTGTYIGSDFVTFTWSEWSTLFGSHNFEVTFEDVDYLFDPDRFDLTLTIVARLNNIVITPDILDSDVVWSRYSEDAQGVERKQSDKVWNAKRANSGKSLHLTIEDCDFNGYIPKTLRFTATVTLRDTLGNAVDAQDVSFLY